MSVSNWLRANNLDGRHYALARSLLMSGPKATPPTFRAIRKMIGRLHRGDKPGPNGYGSWRAAKAVKHVGDT